MSLGIAGTQHHVPIVELPVTLTAEREQIARSLPTAPGEETDVVQLRPAAVETSRHLTPPVVPPADFPDDTPWNVARHRRLDRGAPSHV
jgi:hypothetical protein